MTKPPAVHLQSALYTGQRRVLELIASGSPLGEVLEALCEVVEAHAPGALCTILLMHPDGVRLRHGAAPSVPEAFARFAQDLPTGPGTTPCGLEAHGRNTIIVHDFAGDPDWAHCRGMAQDLGCASCVSMPILGPGDWLLGTFALYHREAGPFSEDETGLLRSATDLAAVAIQNHQREDVLREREAFLKLLFDEAAVGMLVVSPSLIIERANPAFARLLGYEPVELVGKHIRDISRGSEMESVLALDAKLLRGDIPSFQIEKHYIHKSGRPVLTLLQAGLIRDALGKPRHFIGQVMDITERKRSAEALRQAQKLESLGVLAGGIAHDFNNLLTAMLGNLNLAQMHGSPAAQPFLENMERSVLRASDLARQMLAYSGKGRFVVKAQDLNAVVSEMTHLLSVSISKKVALRFQPG